VTGGIGISGYYVKAMQSFLFNRLRVTSILLPQCPSAFFRWINSVFAYDRVVRATLPNKAGRGTNQDLNSAWGHVGAGAFNLSGPCASLMQFLLMSGMVSTTIGLADDTQLSVPSLWLCRSMVYRVCLVVLADRKPRRKSKRAYDL